MVNGYRLAIDRRCTPVVDAEYDFESNRSAVEAITVALADAAGVDPVDLPPLYDYVDSDALNSLFERFERGKDSETILSFQVDTWNVFVHSDGRISICDATQPTDPEPVFESIIS
ncbi:HalOD1 output domain-containing protein [Haloarcula sp. GH36]|uniref:HalOD1 output domain-containing protein n=1 Tax=Haloarcula montana TaxID=3111776 RepID=UPI002D7690D3|nr:HalOD1 output domain-containing protein [Haloarcula sp. GH36]